MKYIIICFVFIACSWQASGSFQSVVKVYDSHGNDYACINTMYYDDSKTELTTQCSFSAVINNKVYKCKFAAVSDIAKKAIDIEKECELLFTKEEI